MDDKTLETFFMVKIYLEIEFLIIQRNYNLKVDKIKKQR